MFFVFEIMFLVVLGIITIVALATVGRPMAIAYSEKLKTRYREIGSDEANNLKVRLAAAEEEIRDLKRQISNLQDSSDFAIKLIEQQTGQKISLPQSQGQEKSSQK